MGRNKEIDLYRLLFAVVVLFLHSHGLNPPDPTSYPFCGGYLAVEFFLMLTGYFAAGKAERETDREGAARKAVIWTGKKFLRLYQYVIPAVVIHYLVTAWLQRLSWFEAAKLLLYGSFEMLLLPETGIYETFLVLSLWYLSALLVVLPLFYFAALKLRDALFCLLAPLSALLIYGYFSITYGHLDVWSEWTGGFFLSLPRAWAGLCLGGLCYFLAKNLRQLPFSKVGSAANQSLKVICLVAALFYMFTRYRRRLDVLCVGALLIVLTITVFKMTDGTKTGGGFLAEYSLALYVSHWTVREVIPSVMKEAAYAEMLGPYLLCSLLYAGLLTVGVGMIRKLSLGKRFKHRFLLPEEKQKREVTKK